MMKLKFTLLLMLVAFLASAQQTANRFFYELTFKPKTDSAKLDKVMTILDITDKKSIYQDFTVPSQDSIMKVEVEAMQKSGVYKDMSKTIKMPKFNYKIEKTYPDMKVTFSDMISTKKIGYVDPTKFNWKILPDKSKIGDYTAQKATTEFGGRQWTAWFTTDLPFPDGPYKFHGLPGLIVKLEDADKNYTWELKGNKKVNNYSEVSFAESMSNKMGMNSNLIIVDRAKFEKSYDNFKQDPLNEFRGMIPAEAMGQKMPGSDKTIGEMLKEQERRLKDFFNANNNPIERPTPKK